MPKSTATTWKYHLVSMGAVVISLRLIAYVMLLCFSDWSFKKLFLYFLYLQYIILYIIYKYFRSFTLTVFRFLFIFSCFSVHNLYVYVFVPEYTYIYIHIYLYIPSYIYLYIPIYTYIYIHICLHNVFSLLHSQKK